MAEQNRKNPSELNGRTEFQERSGRDRLLDSAKREFLNYGFQRSSLRRISASAGLTTGAVYFFFRNKEDLFSAIVEDTAEELTHLLVDLTSEELEQPYRGVEFDAKMMDFLYQHREEMRILLEGAAGTRYAGFMTELFVQMRAAFLLFFRKYGAPDVDEELVRILAEMRIKGNLELLKGGYSMERLIELTRQVGIYADGGFQSLTSYLKKSNKA